MGVVGNLLYLLVVLCVGLLARRVGLVDDRRRDLLSAFAYYVALPGLVFTSTASQSLDEVFSARLVAGFWAVLLSIAAIGWVFHGRESSPSTRSVAVVQSYHCNFGFLGLPLVAATFGGVVTAKASIVLGLGSLTQTPLTLAVLGFVNGADTDVRSEIRGMATNPVLIALATGLGCAALGVAVPDAVSAGLGALGELALPVALVAVGASLSLGGGIDPSTVGSVVAIKTVLMPVVALVVFSLLSADPSTTRAGVVMLAMPTAISTFIYASELGGDTSLASANVFASTVASVGTLLVLLQFV